MQALSAFKGSHISADKLAKAACEIEMEKCREPIGKQDQYISSFGGFNLIEFHPDEGVHVSPIICLQDTLKQLESNILLFYTGVTRSASLLLAQQSSLIESDDKKREILSKMVDLTYVLATELQNNNVDAMGEILHEGWMLKKSIISAISTSQIDEWYSIAMKAGATGGKLLGAGAGGFLMIYAPKERHLKIINSLNGLRQIPVKFETSGSKIIFYNMEVLNE
jgi:D-glycero-alpha-D-manno-heptose-7-phosphate kinase